MRRRSSPDIPRILALRIILGVGICFGSFQAPWQALPVLIDRKIAQDPLLPLSSLQITCSQTAIFVGWLLGAVLLHPLMQRLQMKEVVVLMALTMLGLSVATITLPYITPLSMTLLCLVRLHHGMCLNIQGVQYMYMQHCFPGRGSELCSLVNALYAVVAVLMALLCGTLTRSTDWRVEALIWFGLPIFVGLLLGFPDLGSVVRGLPKALGTAPATAPSAPRPSAAAPSAPEQGEGEEMSPAMRRDLANLGVCFMATVFAYYGLSYSADSLSSNPFVSATLISGSDVLACLLASRAARWGLLRAQRAGFLTAAVALLACALGGVDSAFTMAMAILARMALSVVFVTIYVALAQIFPERYQKIALPTCEIMALKDWWSVTSGEQGSLPTILDAEGIDKPVGAAHMEGLETIWLNHAGSIPELMYAVVTVLVQVLAAGVNNTEINTRLGWYSKAVKVATSEAGANEEAKDDGGWSGKTPFPLIQGTDCCGRVVSAGDENAEGVLGKRVLIRSCQRGPQGFASSDTKWMASDFDGAFAQFVCVRRSEVFAVDCDWSDEELGSIPCAYGTAENMLEKVSSFLMDVQSGTIGSPGPGPCAVLSDSFQEANRKVVVLVVVLDNLVLEVLPSGLGRCRLFRRFGFYFIGVTNNKEEQALNTIWSPFSLSSWQSRPDVQIWSDLEWP
ncbi:unnamed protein product, partial [Effrenium voratum]